MHFIFILPDRTFGNVRTTNSFDPQIICSLKTSIGGFWGSKIKEAFCRGHFGKKHNFFKRTLPLKQMVCFLWRGKLNKFKNSSQLLFEVPDRPFFIYRASKSAKRYVQTSKHSSIKFLKSMVGALFESFNFVSSKRKRKTIWLAGLFTK